jgi:hypothetical protein
MTDYRGALLSHRTYCIVSRAASISIRTEQGNDRVVR